MTREQRHERDFWLGCAERAEMRVQPYNLCYHGYGDERREQAIDLFLPEDARVSFWWDYDGILGHFSGADVASGRVLAACFLAAMAELGE